MGHATIFCDCVLAPQELVDEIRFEQPVRLLREYRGFLHRGSRNYFLRITAAFKSAYLAIDKTQQVGVNLHICGFQLTVGLQ